MLAQRYVYGPENRERNELTQYLVASRPPGFKATHAIQYGLVDDARLTSEGITTNEIITDSQSPGGENLLTLDATAK